LLNVATNDLLDDLAQLEPGFDDDFAAAELAASRQAHASTAGVPSGLGSEEVGGLGGKGQEGGCVDRDNHDLNSRQQPTSTGRSRTPGKGGAAAVRGRPADLTVATTTPSAAAAMRSKSSPGNSRAMDSASTPYAPPQRSAIDNPQRQLERSLLLLAEQEKTNMDGWKANIDGLDSLRHLLEEGHGRAVVVPSVHVVVLRLVALSDNLRSQVARSALHTLSDLFCTCAKGRAMDREVEAVLPYIIRRCSDTNKVRSVVIGVCSVVGPPSSDPKNHRQ
jgi:hypothetical protein